MDATDWITAVGTALAAIGTVGAFIAALVQINRERDARKRLEREADQRDRRAQAERISAWPYIGRRTEILVSNRSEEPVYRVVASLVMIQGDGPGQELEPHFAGYRAHAGAHSAREWRTTVDIDWSGIHSSGMSPGVELAFTDRAGVHWVRSADGSLLEISQPLEVYDLGLPTHWRSSSPA